eukprot:SAG25_NODE_88_length_16343_cov_89.495383_4_plen_88_part_00
MPRGGAHQLPGELVAEEAVLRRGANQPHARQDSQHVPIDDALPTPTTAHTASRTSPRKRTIRVREDIMGHSRIWARRGISAGSCQAQ